MSTFNAIKPRIFDVLFVCDCCRSEKSYPITTAISSDTEHNEILDELTMYRPFCCEQCGHDGFDVSAYEERQNDHI
jgi:hypothetical protein